jgi:hypothetical protein
MSGPTSATDSLLTVHHGTDQLEEKHMFTTDSFLGAEIKYRQDKVRQDYRPRRWVRRNDATTTEK